MKKTIIYFIFKNLTNTYKRYIKTKYDLPLGWFYGSILLTYMCKRALFGYHHDTVHSTINGNDSVILISYCVIDIFARKVKRTEIIILKRKKKNITLNKIVQPLPENQRRVILYRLIRKRLVIITLIIRRGFVGKTRKLLIKKKIIYVNIANQTQELW